MRIPKGAFDVAVIHRLLHQLEVPAVAQQLGPEIVPIVVEPEIHHARLGAHPLPSRLGPGERKLVPLPPHPAKAFIAVHRDIGENELRMLALQREENFADGVGDWEHHASAALPDSHDLAGSEIHLRPFKRHAFRLPQATGADELEERAIVVAYGLIECRSLIVLQLAHPLHRLGKQ